MYRDFFLSLHCQSSNGKQNLAKPLLLLSMLRLIDNGSVKNNIFYFEDIQREYAILQKEYNVKAPCQYPVYYMESEEFYHIKWLAEAIKVNVPSAKFIRDNVQNVYLDNALWDLLQEDQIRKDFTSSVVNFYLKII